MRDRYPRTMQSGRFGAPAPAPAPVTWAVGGGKGGVGKSVITSSLAIALAERGLRCAAVDADFGAANLHTVLGVPRPERTLSHFIKLEVEPRCSRPRRTRT